MISINDIDKTFIDTLFEKTDDIINHSDSNGNCRLNTHSDKILVSAFFEPSTRTQLSFESAMKSLGGSVINFNSDTSSLKKGESFKDTIKTLSIYGDIIVLRHPQSGSAKEASKYSNIPIINAGDGNNEHPTQALLDLYTIYKSFDNNLIKVTNILFVGDCKNSRTIRSLIQLLHLYPHISIYFLPYSGCYPSDDMLDIISIKQKTNPIVLNKNLPIPYHLFDVIYCTRLQKERIFTMKQESQLRADLVITKDVLNKCKNDVIIMHPFPRNNEISTEIDDEPNAIYFKQMEYGVKIRMALLDILLSR